LVGFLSVVWALVAVASPADASGHRTLFFADGADPLGRTRLKVDGAALESLMAGEGRGHIDLPLGGDETITLEMERFEVVGASARFVVSRAGRTADVAVPGVKLLRGSVLGERGSHAFLALNDAGGGSGSITRGDQRTLHLLTDQHDGAVFGLVVMEGPAGLPDFDEFCRVVDERREEGGAAGSAGVNPALGPRLVAVAIDSDESYSDLFYDDVDAALAYIVQLVGAVSDVYLRDQNMRLVLDFARVWPDGGEPFAADDLGGFRSYWQENEDTSGLNLVHLLSARRNLSYGGIAYLSDACSGQAYAISAFLLGGFISPLVQPDLGNWDVVVVAHEMGHNLGTPHTHDYDPPADQCTSNVEERGSIMSYCHVQPGGLLNIDVRLHADTQLLIDADNPDGACLPHDCNANGVDDQLDLLLEASHDDDGNGVPDECDDRDGNGVLDSADILAGAPDVNANAIPDSAEPDCNANALPDRWEILQALADDLNGNFVPDLCEPDCDGNGVADHVDIREGTHADLDRNSVPDACQDCNGNGLPDWIDMDRQFNVFMGTEDGLVREYHAASGVLVQEHGRGLLAGPRDVAFGPDGRLYVASFFAGQVVALDVDAGTGSVFVPAIIGGHGRPSALAFGPDGHLYVAIQNSASVLRFDGASGALLGTFVTPGSGGLISPRDLLFTPGGNLLISSGNNRVFEYSGIDGSFVRVFVNNTSGLNGPRGMVFLPNGDLLVVNQMGNNVTRYGPDGSFIAVFNDEYPVTSPWGIALGPGGNAFIARNVNSNYDAWRLIEYDGDTGRYQRAFVRGDEELQNPTQFAFRPASPHDANGNLLLDACEPAACPADLVPGGGVGGDDLGELLLRWGTADKLADLTDDGVVDGADLGALLRAWGACGSAAP